MVESVITVCYVDYAYLSVAFRICFLTWVQILFQPTKVYMDDDLIRCQGRLPMTEITDRFKNYHKNLSQSIRIQRYMFS